MSSDLFNKIRLLLHPKKGSYFVLYKVLGFLPKNISFYEEALLHKSSSNDKFGQFPNNERLEFLGDAILDAVVAHIVFNRFKNKDEGFLTNTRSKIVKREMLDMVSRELGLNHLVISSSYIKTQKSHIFGNALEAFIGAVYLDQGFQKTYQFIEQRIINNYINIETLAKKEVNFKSKLLEWGQKFKVDLEFKLVENFTDDEHNQVFQSQVMLNGLSSGIGTGYSKKESQQQASQMALKKIKANKDFVEEVLKQEIKQDLSPTLSETPNLEPDTQSKDIDGDIAE